MPQPMATTITDDKTYNFTVRARAADGSVVTRPGIVVVLREHLGDCGADRISGEQQSRLERLEPQVPEAPARPRRRTLPAPETRQGLQAHR